MAHQNADTQGRGPLRGLRVVEFAGLGPAPFGCMLLADMGAEVVLVDRPGARAAEPANVVRRGRTLVHADLKDAQQREDVARLVDAADVLVEGFRPGVMERLGLGPELLMARNPRLVYARMTGWGQHGPLSPHAGHDINYIAITGALGAIGTAEQPLPPLNLVGDYGGGSTYLVMGILAAVHEARGSGRGQVVDAAISDGVISLMAQHIGQLQRGSFREQRGANLLDGGAPWYAAYETADGKHVCIGALEPQFFAIFCERTGLDPRWRADRLDAAQWPHLREELALLFRSKSRAAWAEILEPSDACISPVLSLSEAMAHPHNVAREAFVKVGETVHPAPAPRFSRTPCRVPAAPAAEAVSLDAVLGRWQAGA